MTVLVTGDVCIGILALLFACKELQVKHRFPRTLYENGTAAKSNESGATVCALASR